MRAKILIIDHNDSFTFNLVQLLEEAGAEVFVISAVQAALSDLENYDGVVLSPGPGLPGDYPGTAEVIQRCVNSNGEIPLLGVCLGFQAIVQYYGGQLYNLQQVLHGRRVCIQAGLPCPVFGSLTFPMEVGLYHSWAMDAAKVPAELLITSRLRLDENNRGKMFAQTELIPMSIRHISLPVFGLQFHPESFMTPDGDQIIKNWLVVVACAIDKQSPAEKESV